MPITRQQKENHVAEIKDLISKSNVIVVWDYLGLSATDISGVRAAIRNENAVNKVYKNRVAKIAFKDAGKEEIIDILEGSSSFLFIESDESNALKELNKYIKENDNISFKAGYIDGEYYDADAIAELAGLPSKEDLLSMLLSALQGTMRNLAYSLSQVAAQAPADDSVTLKEETVTEEVKEETASAEESNAKPEPSTEETEATEAPAEAEEKIQEEKAE